MNPYVVFLLYLLAILGFVGVTLLLNRLLGPKPVPSEMKLEPFECGATPVDPLNLKAVPIKYYAVAIVFILFDLETVFLYIWALGACAVSGGFYQNYATLQGIDKIIPVDIYIPGCPPRPETVIDGIMKLQDRIARSKHVILTKDF